MSILNTEEMFLNMGPQHPSTHGLMRLILKTDGEIVSGLDIDIGYLHRSIEKIAEKVTYPQFMPYTDRIDYLGSMNCNWGYALTVEKLMGIEVPRRAEFIRVIVGELNRIASHLIMTGGMGLEAGAFTPFLHVIREREKINDLLEMACGARLTYNYIRIGGVSQDLPLGFIEKTREFLDYLEPKIDSLNRLLSENKIFIKRIANIGIIDAQSAINNGVVGPNLRASGVKWDLRRDEPYSVYPELDFEIPVGTDDIGTLGDCHNRYILRIREIQESSKIIRQCLERISEGEFQAKVSRVIKPPAGEAYVRTEAPRGELGFYLISDGSTNPYRLRIRTGSYTATSAIREIAKGSMISDVVMIVGSLDPVVPEIDR